MFDCTQTSYRTSGERLNSTISPLSSDGTAFSTVIEQARLMFSNPAETAEAIKGGAAMLSQRRAEIRHGEQIDQVGIRSIFHYMVRPPYPMPIEREMHDRVLLEMKLAASSITFLARKSTAVPTVLSNDWQNVQDSNLVSDDLIVDCIFGP